MQGRRKVVCDTCGWIVSQTPHYFDFKYRFKAEAAISTLLKKHCLFYWQSFRLILLLMKSVINWRRCWFLNHEDIYTFIHICCILKNGTFWQTYTYIVDPQTGYIPEAGIETQLTWTPIQDSTTQPRGYKRKRRKFKRWYITLVFVYIYPLNRELDSYEEPCITLESTEFPYFLNLDIRFYRPSL